MSATLVILLIFLRIKGSKSFNIKYFPFPDHVMVILWQNALMNKSLFPDLQSVPGWIPGKHIFPRFTIFQYVFHYVFFTFYYNEYDQWNQLLQYFLYWFQFIDIVHPIRHIYWLNISFFNHIDGLFILILILNFAILTSFFAYLLLFYKSINILVLIIAGIDYFSWFFIWDYIFEN